MSTRAAVGRTALLVRRALRPPCASPALLLLRHGWAAQPLGRRAWPPPPLACRALADAAHALSKPSALQETSGRQLVLSPPALVVTREYEWANILVGFEQANRYSIRAAPGGQVVGYLAEEESVKNTITRNVLRTHRPFKAAVFDKDRNVVFTIRRPMYLISTSIFVETGEGDVLGEVHMNWHPWRRRYDLYVDKTQFAAVDGGFLAVDFDMRDVEGRKVASVNKDFTGFAREIFTDARQYVLRMDPAYGLAHDGMLVNDRHTIDLPQEEYGEVKMSEKERAVILATAIAIDFDYFSMHSRGMNPMFMPIPGGSGAPAPAPPGGAGVGGAGAAVGADAMSGMAGEDSDNFDAAPHSTDSPINDQTPYTPPGGVDADPFGTPINEADSGQDESEWATFEEPDHGFEDPFPDENSWSDDGQGFGSESGGFGDGGGLADDGEGGGGLIGTIMSIFNIFSDND